MYIYIYIYTFLKVCDLKKYAIYYELYLTNICILYIDMLWNNKVIKKIYFDSNSIMQIRSIIRP